MIPWLIIDGCNLIHRCGAPPGGSARDFEICRRLWIAALEKLTGILAGRLTLVFDGCRAQPAAEPCQGPVEVLFSSGGQTADSVIERLAYGARPGEVTVVSSDRLEVQTASASGAEGMSCSVFYDLVRETQARITSGLCAGRRATPSGKPLANPFDALQLP